MEDKDKIIAYLEFLLSLQNSLSKLQRTNEEISKLILRNSKTSLKSALRFLSYQENDLVFVKSRITCLQKKMHKKEDEQGEAETVRI